MFNIQKLNVQDEIPNGAIRFDIKTNDGQTIYSNIDIKMITEILQTGTPLNKALHDKIDYMAECISKLDDVGNDIERFIMTGEFQGLELLQIDSKEYDKIKLNEKIENINQSISSIDNRVKALEGV